MYIEKKISSQIFEHNFITLIPSSYEWNNLEAISCFKRHLKVNLFSCAVFISETNFIVPTIAYRVLATMCTNHKIQYLKSANTTRLD